jgi:16S rRNA G1207 methylase RsmC
VGLYSAPVVDPAGVVPVDSDRCAPLRPASSIKQLKETGIRPYPQEELLIDALAELTGKRLLCTSPGLAQFAGAAARALPSTTVTCAYLDLYRANLATDYWRESPPNLQIVCVTDLPEEEADVVVFPFSAGGEAELTRDFIQSGHLRLRIGGRLFAATDNRDDAWLRDQLGTVFRKVERRASSTGVLYVATKTAPLKRTRYFGCEFAFRDNGRLLRAYSRPGVFSHRSLDAGARHLLNEMQIDSGARVLDIGCGAGVVALAAACRADRVTVHAVDSNCRAVECTQRGAEMNGLTNITTELNADGGYAGTGSYDLVLANPPYYSGFRIAEHFVTAGRASLRPGGKILVVTKRPDWYQENMPEWYESVTVHERKSYHLIQGVRPD